MSGQPPAEGDKITIRWPGGPRDFEMDFDHLDPYMPPAEHGWYWLHGSVGSEHSERFGITYHDYRTLYARYVSEGVYEMMPHGGKRADVQA